MKIGDSVLDATGELWEVLNAPCSIRGAESAGFLRRVRDGGQQYGEQVPGPWVIWEVSGER